MTQPRDLAKAALLGAALAVASLATFATFAGCAKAAPEPTPETRATAAPEPETPEPPDLIKEDLSVGTGAEAKDGDKVKLNYTGRLLKTNFMFDTSTGPGKKPFEFTIGKGGAIDGWQKGIPGMKVGGKRKLTIPSRLAYGDKGTPPKIPGKATLVFEVELLSVNETPDAGADGGGDTPDGGKKKKKKDQ
jgi:FKBP-type peptidyl-prolyl cis-trans isomerase